MNKGAKTMRVHSQIEKLYENLNRELDSFPSGSRFYSLNQIAMKFQVHRRIIDAALEKMKADKLVYSVPRVGLFSNVSRKQAAFRVVLAQVDWPSESGRRWDRAAFRYAEEHGQWQLVKQIMTGENEGLDAISTQNADALVIRYWHSRFSEADMRWFARQSIPVVMLGHDTGDFQISSVGSADGEGAIQVCGYLRKHGHRSVLMVIGEPMGRIKWYRNFPVAAEALGMDCRVLDCGSDDFFYSRQRAYETVKEYLLERGGRADFTAVYVVFGESVSGVMKALREFNYRIPEDISILGHSDEEDGEFTHPPLTTVAHSIANEVAAVFDGLAGCLTGGAKSFNVKLPLRIIERDSVATLKQ